MSDHVGSSSSHISYDGAQRTVEGDRGVNPGWPCGRVGGDSSSFDS